MTLQIGILSFAHLHAPAYAAALSGRSEAVLAGIWDPDTNRGTNAATRFGCQFFPELGDLLSCGLDGVVICAENTRRRDLVERSAEAHVRVILCEKPIATSTDDAQAMIAACAQGGSHLATAFPCRYSPAFQRLESTIKDGYLGDVLAIRATNRGTLPGGWFTDVALSGGGAVIATGAPEEVAMVEGSYTGEFLKKLLDV